MKEKAYTVLAGLMCLLLIGCATAKPVPLPSGDAGFSIWCEEYKSRCYTKAAEACPGGYEIIDASGGGQGALVNNVGAFVSTYEMLIKCKYSRNQGHQTEIEQTQSKSELIQQCIDACVKATAKSQEACFNVCVD